MSAAFAYTGEEAVSSQALRSFQSEFAGATDVNWIAGKNYYKAEFTLDNQKMFAFYDTEGEFMAVTRYISSFQLPLNLQRTLKKSYSNYWISDLFEVASYDETGYYVTLENADTKVVIKSVDGSNWTLYQKSQKA